ncbi:hypothetical protein AZI87_17860 [Bdellovibrio bacteriovorus]|uniref:Uncharacterized protein n=1 Tax=Bdellovibrio bacteriovorus TaxID=959 RepID=A0A150WJ97_BDEBC|nr:hypothetical protein AZI87_17860 [Bdellovibrio bacteriovorus]KYG63515.1 hypothetical protein AZI85_05685 [Bdellovibrio bacteriovorus]
MLSIKSKSTHAELDHILNFVDASKGLRAKINESGRVQIRQDLDGKLFSFNSQDVNEVLHRADSEGKPFVQVNFKNGTKVLLTETLVGFKPLETLGLDMGRIPKVVTTPDLVSVFDAIEESLGADNGLDHEVEILKKVYMAIVSGGEKVGFDLTTERLWLNRLIASKFKASA